ncbi:hypothetical protein [Thalassotalea piscium]|uniref:Uncharacterized protein n=1 Tax=Thalassotalea piscium TaxID=1230533 RepID=A0A7X0NGM2_9GAMM|nr:hypothetical protein [Thalassotalea piscium]MBB6543078.1 hypothetical protein [Thalassotalea piscium]
MELWKFVLLWIVTLLAKSVGFLWALNELFGLNIGYSLVSISASVVFLFCINGSLPGASKSSEPEKYATGSKL